jgi:hypothetical protein
MKTFSGIGKRMNPGFFLNPVKFLLITGLLVFVWHGIGSPSVFAQNDALTESTDLSTMDWSDSPAKASGSDQNLAKEIKAGDDLSKMSWADEGDDPSAKLEKEALAAERQLDDAAQAKKEGKIHSWGFLLFIGYLGGCLLTGFFSRNRKLAVTYPPELLIVLHSVWPLEWVFLLFAGKKVR